MSNNDPFVPEEHERCVHEGAAIGGALVAAIVGLAGGALVGYNIGKQDAAVKREVDRQIDVQFATGTTSEEAQASCDQMGGKIWIEWRQGKYTLTCQDVDH